MALAMAVMRVAVSAAAPVTSAWGGMPSRIGSRWRAAAAAAAAARRAANPLLRKADWVGLVAAVLVPQALTRPHPVVLLAVVLVVPVVLVALPASVAGAFWVPPGRRTARVVPGKPAAASIPRVCLAVAAVAVARLLAAAVAAVLQGPRAAAVMTKELAEGVVVAHPPLRA